jgi:DHA2 family multidrug resistance protein-like MFS transporter
MTAMRQVGATIGVAVLGTVLSTVYRSKLVAAGLAPAAAAAAKSSVGAGAAVALRLRSPQLLASVHTAYAGGVDVMLWVCAAIAIAAAILAWLFLPRQPADVTQPTGAAQADVGAAADAKLGSAAAE